MTAVNALGDFKLSSHRLAFIDGDGMELFCHCWGLTLLTLIPQRIPGVRQRRIADMPLSVRTRLDDHLSGLKLEFITTTKMG